MDWFLGYAALTPSTHSQTRILVLVLLCATVTETSRPNIKPNYQEDGGLTTVEFECEENELLAPGPLWECDNMNKTALHTLAGHLIGQVKVTIDAGELGRLVPEQSIESCVFVCAHLESIRPFCPNAFEVLKLTTPSCGYLTPCSNGASEVKHCPNGCNMMVQAKQGEPDIYMYVHHNEGNHLVINGKIYGGDGEEDAVKLKQALLHFGPGDYKAKSMIGYQVFSESEEPSLWSWTPSSCFADKFKDNPCSGVCKSLASSALTGGSPIDWTIILIVLGVLLAVIIIVCIIKRRYRSRMSDSGSYECEASKNPISRGNPIDLPSLQATHNPYGISQPPPVPEKPPRNISGPLHLEKPDHLKVNVEQAEDDVAEDSNSDLPDVIYAQADRGTTPVSFSPPVKKTPPPPPPKLGKSPPEDGGYMNYGTVDSTTDQGDQEAGDRTGDRADKTKSSGPGIFTIENQHYDTAE